MQSFSSLLLIYSSCVARAWVTRSIKIRAGKSCGCSSLQWPNPNRRDPPDGELITHKSCSALHLGITCIEEGKACVITGDEPLGYIFSHSWRKKGWKIRQHKPINSVCVQKAVVMTLGKLHLSSLFHFINTFKDTNITSRVTTYISEVFFFFPISFLTAPWLACSPPQGLASLPPLLLTTPPHDTWWFTGKQLMPKPIYGAWGNDLSIAADSLPRGENIPWATI